MKTATVRDLRYDFPRIEAWLAGGEEIVITKRGKPIATLGQPKRAASGKGAAKPKLPDYRARAEKIFGERVFTQAEVDEMRAFETGEP